MPIDDIDWKSIALRYMSAVVKYDAIVAVKCLSHPDHAPEWTDKELAAVTFALWENL